MATTSASSDLGLMAEINITPFTDVLLVLLVIFMLLAALSTPPGFQKQLEHPQPNSTLDAARQAGDEDVGLVTGS